jgi:hypothetical protein
VSPLRRERNTLVRLARLTEGLACEVESKLTDLRAAPGASNSWQYAHHALAHLREAASALWLASERKGGGDAGR